MKTLLILALSCLVSAQVFAAKFSPIIKVSSASSQRLAEVGQKIVENEEMFGDSGAVEAFSFSRKDTESDRSTMKQLSYKNRATSDDTQVDFLGKSTKEIVNFALYAVENQDNEEAKDFIAGRLALTEAINAVKADKSLKIYGNQHADEDGSWNILFIFDTKTNQILMVKIGYSGT